MLSLQFCNFFCISKELLWRDGKTTDQCCSLYLVLGIHSANDVKRLTMSAQYPNPRMRNSSAQWNREGSSRAKRRTGQGSSSKLTLKRSAEFPESWENPEDPPQCALHRAAHLGFPLVGLGDQVRAEASVAPPKPPPANACLLLRQLTWSGAAVGESENWAESPKWDGRDEGGAAAATAFVLGEVNWALCETEATGGREAARKRAGGRTEFAGKSVLGGRWRLLLFTVASGIWEETVDSRRRSPFLPPSLGRARTSANDPRGSRRVLSSAVTALKRGEDGGGRDAGDERRDWGGHRGRAWRRPRNVGGEGECCLAPWGGAEIEPWFGGAREGSVFFFYDEAEGEVGTACQEGASGLGSIVRFRSLEKSTGRVGGGAQNWFSSILATGKRET